MQDLIVALYADHTTAAAVRTALVTDGFPTDRVEVTSPREHRQADMSPDSDFATKVAEYFRTLSADAAAARKLDEFTQAIVHGASVVTVHPRGQEEIRRAEAILQQHRPREVYRHLPRDAGHVADRKIERAATPATRD